MCTAPCDKPTPQTTGSKERPWTPRFWDGMGIWTWWSLVFRNRAAIVPSRIPMAILVTIFSILNSLLGVLQLIFFGRKIARTKIQDDPIFVIGHWRSGTTLLHELLVLDERHTYSDTYACFTPQHFLVSGWFLRPLLKVLLPRRRPMDNMAAGWDRPQEDEFALCNMGGRSPYLTMAFPNRPPQDQEYFDLEGLLPQARERWKRRMVWFLKCITLRHPQRIVLKSPPHTFRIKALLELFPNARFIHIIRNPYVIFPSTIKLWKCLYRDQGLQVFNGKGLEEHVFETFNRMYEVFERQRRLIPPARLCEVRYEDLVADPIGQMRAVYRELELGEFDRVLPAIRQYFADKADYQTNRFQLAPEQCAEIGRRWRSFIERYGYAAPPGAAGATEAGRAGGATMRSANVPVTSFGMPPRPPADTAVAGVSRVSEPRESSSL
ncbi:MAG: sulfotransferase family protein [Thermoguttaceae bacterium]